MPTLKAQISKLKFQNVTKKIILPELFSKQISESGKQKKFSRQKLTTNRLLLTDFGFTLIELLIVVALIGILSTVILANYNSFGRRQEVRNGAENLKSEIRKYQTFAIAGQKDPVQTNACDDLTLEHYEILVYKPDPFDVGDSGYGARIFCGSDDFEVTEQTPWSKRVILEEVGSFSSGVPISADQIFIQFFPVDKGAKLFINDVEDSFLVDSVYMKLTNDAASAVYNVIVTKAGEIYVEKE